MRRASSAVGSLRIGPKRVVTDHQVGAFLDCYVDVGGVAYATVDVVDAVDARGLVDDRQRGRGLHRLGDAQLRILVGAEDDALGRVELTSGDVELVVAMVGELTKVVGHLDALEVVPEPALERRVVEQAARDGVGERGERTPRRDLVAQAQRHALDVHVVGRAQQLAERVVEGARQARQTS